MIDIIHHPDRLEALEQYQIMDTPPDKDLDEIVELASKICGKPISLISLLDQNRQWFKARVGLDVDQTPVDIAFCRYAIQDNQVFVVNDATKDERFVDNPLVTGKPDIRFYAGTPLTTFSGQNIGTLCVIDNKPGEITPDQLDALRILGKQVVKQFELKKALRLQNQHLFKLNEQRVELEDLVKFKDKVFALIGHDLKGPIGSVSQLMSMFRTGVLSAEELREVAETIELQIRDTESILNNVLTWAKSNRAGHTPQKVSTRLDDLIQSVIEQNRLEAENKQIQIFSDAPLKDYSANIDAESVEIVLRNLVRNSVKFSLPGGQVQVGYKATDHELLFYVKDTGVGFDDAVASRLFKDEEHVTTYGTAKEKGTGIGLLICKNLVQRNGGKIWAEGQPLKGAQFYFTLPI